MGKNGGSAARHEHEEGIKATRMMFPRTYFDQDKAGPLLEHLKRYKRTIHLKTGEPGAPLHDEHSHGADMFRYAAWRLTRWAMPQRSSPFNTNERCSHERDQDLPGRLAARGMPAIPCTLAKGRAGGEPARGGRLQAAEPAAGDAPRRGRPPKTKDAD